MLDTVAIVSGVRHENLQLTATLERILRNQLGGLQCSEAALVSSREWVLTRGLIPDRGRGTNSGMLSLGSQMPRPNRGCPVRRGSWWRRSGCDGYMVMVMRVSSSVVV